MHLAIYALSNFVEQRSAIKFCLPIDISTAEEGKERVDDLQRSIDGQNINKIKEMVLGNRRLTIRELVGISFGSVQTILKDHLGLKRFISCLVPKFLNFFGKERRV